MGKITGARWCANMRSDIKTLVGACKKTRCPRQSLNIIHFAPPVRQGVPHNVKRRARFDKALETFLQAKDELSRLEAVTILNNTRNAYCNQCSDGMRKCRHNVSTKDGSCREEWLRILSDAVLKGCNDCGARVAICLDHVNPTTKIRAVSDYYWWSRPPGLNTAPVMGVEGMRLEAQKCVPRCRFCHALQPTGNQARRVDPDQLPYGRYDTPQYQARICAKVKWPKYQYVDSIKLKRGSCARCFRQVTAETAVGFEFNHIDPATKLCKIAKICNASSKSKSIEHVRTDIDMEVAKCELLCANCHYLHTTASCT